MIAVYRLSENIPSFEFFVWLVLVKARGATEIGFDVANPRTTKKFTDFGLTNVMTRFHSIVEPGPALAGLPHRFVDGSVQTQANGSFGELAGWVRAGNKFERLRSVREPIACDYTVTIRDNEMGSARARDSNRETWTQFAQEIGAVVIDDYSRKPIHLHERFALYAGAKMNFGVCNGPMHTLSLTPYPVTKFANTVSARNGKVKESIAPGQNFPWMLPNQKLLWQDDTLDNLRAMFEMVGRHEAETSARPEGVRPALAGGAG